jgi:GT2 family glycosyltransferase
VKQRLRSLFWRDIVGPQNKQVRDLVKLAPISVGIPTFGRGLRMAETLEHLAACDPPPAEIIVHVDQSDGRLERELKTRFPQLRILSSAKRVGPGGGRHRCLLAATQPFLVSFDDDSWPTDRKFFSEVARLFELYPRAAILAASIYYPDQPRPECVPDVKIVTDYTGCGHAIRLSAYIQTAGYIDRQCAYGIEEVDLAMQLYSLDWAILECGSLRVFHDSQLSHHSKADIVAGRVQNVALMAFLRYPAQLWPRGLLQLGNVIFNMIKRRRFAGLGEGLLGIPVTLFRYTSCRRQLPAAKIRSYLNARQRLPS